MTNIGIISKDFVIFLVEMLSKKILKTINEIPKSILLQ